MAPTIEQFRASRIDPTSEDPNLLDIMEGITGERLPISDEAKRTWAYPVGNGHLIIAEEVWKGGTCFVYSWFHGDNPTCDTLEEAEEALLELAKFEGSWGEAA